MLKRRINPFSRSSDSYEVIRRRVRENVVRWGATPREATDYGTAIARQRTGRRLSESDEQVINDVRTKYT